MSDVQTQQASIDQCGSQCDNHVSVRPALGKLVPYAPGLRAEQVAEKCPELHICKLSSNEFPSGPFEAVKEAIIKELDGLNEYPDGAASQLKEKITQFYNAHYNTHLTSDNIFVGAGSNELINLLSQAFLEPGDEVCYPWPSFIVYQSAADVMDGEKLIADLDGEFRVDPAALLQKITPKTKIVYVCNPNNPTSTVLAQDELRAFMNAVPKHVLVVFDEAYIEFADKDSTTSGLSFFDKFDNVIVLRTFSKAYGLAGLRVGYGIAPTYVVEAIDKVRAPFNVSTLAQVAACAALDCQDELAQRVIDNAQQRQRLEDFICSTGCVCAASQTNFVFFGVESAQKAQEVFEGLLEHGVIVRPQGPTPYLRITVGNEAETTQCIDALKQLL